MCVKLFPKYLNPNPYLPQPTNTYTYRVTIVSRVYGGQRDSLLIALSGATINFLFN